MKTDTMTYERYEQLMASACSDEPEYALTEKEQAEGWHFCWAEWDGLLIHPSHPEAECCTCPEGKQK